MPVMKYNLMLSLQSWLRGIHTRHTVVGARSAAAALWALVSSESRMALHQVWRALDRLHPAAATAAVLHGEQEGSLAQENLVAAANGGLPELDGYAASAAGRLTAVRRRIAVCGPLGNGAVCTFYLILQHFDDNNKAKIWQACKVDNVNHMKYFYVMYQGICCFISFKILCLTSHYYS